MKAIENIMTVDPEMSHSLNLCHGKINETNHVLKTLQANLMVCSARIDDLNDKCAALQLKNSKLKSELNDF